MATRVLIELCVFKTCSLALRMESRALEIFVDEEIDCGEEDEGQNSCQKQSCPVCVVQDVGGI